MTRRVRRSARDLARARRQGRDRERPVQPPYADMIEIMEASPATPDADGGGPAGPLTRHWPSTGSSATPRARATSCGALGEQQVLQPTMPQAERLVSGRSRCIASAANRTMEAWSLHMLGLAVTAQRRLEEATLAGPTRPSPLLRGRRCRRDHLVLDDLSITGARDDDRAGRAAVGRGAHAARTADGHGACRLRPSTCRCSSASRPHQRSSRPRRQDLAAEGRRAMSLDEVVAVCPSWTAGGVPPTSHAEVGRRSNVQHIGHGWRSDPLLR